jgi:hypothetical protein
MRRVVKSYATYLQRLEGVIVHLHPRFEQAIFLAAPVAEVGRVRDLV